MLLGEVLPRSDSRQVFMVTFLLLLGTEICWFYRVLLLCSINFPCPPCFVVNDRPPVLAGKESFIFVLCSWGVREQSQLN